MSNVEKFTPKPLSNEEFMRRFREECALTGSPVDPRKCEPGDPGTVTTSDGDVLYVGEPIASEQLAPRHWPDPTPEMLTDPRFEAIWQAIKTWDINVPAAYGGYCGATGNHVRAIFDALLSVTRPDGGGAAK